MSCSSERRAGRDHAHVLDLLERGDVDRPPLGSSSAISNRLPRSVARSSECSEPFENWNSFGLAIDA